jgi:hypothetical protein
VDWIHLVRDRDIFRALVNTGMNLRVSKSVSRSIPFSTELVSNQNIVCMCSTCLRELGCSISTVIRLRAGRMENPASIPGGDEGYYIQPTGQWVTGPLPPEVKQSRRAAGHSTPSSAE